MRIKGLVQNGVFQNMLIRIKQQTEKRWILICFRSQNRILVKNRPVHSHAFVRHHPNSCVKEALNKSGMQIAGRAVPMTQFQIKKAVAAVCINEHFLKASGAAQPARYVPSPKGVICSKVP